LSSYNAVIHLFNIRLHQNLQKMNKKIRKPDSSTIIPNFTSEEYKTA